MSGAVTSIAALFVEVPGPYTDVPACDCWGVERDARLYAGSDPVVAHPPCERWGKYATGGPNPRARRRIIGDDDGCFASGVGERAPRRGRSRAPGGVEGVGRART